MQPVPLRRSLFLQFFGLSAVPLLVVLLIAAVVLFRGLIREVERETGTLGSAVRSQIEGLLAGRQTAIELLAMASTAQPDATARVALLRAMVQLDPIIDALYVADASGAIEQLAFGPASGLRESDMLGVDLSSRPFFQAVRAEQRVVWSDTFLSSLTGRVTAVVAVAAGDDVLVAELSLLSLSRLVDELVASTGDLIMVLDSQGRVIGYRDASLASRQVNVRDQALVRQGIEGREAHGRVEWRGKPYLGSVVPIGRTDWSVLVARPTARLYAPVFQLGWSLAAGLVFCLLGALVVAAVLSRRTERRYRTLIQAADSFAQSQQPPPVQFDILEFDQLWQNLRRLFEQIEQRDAETRSARRELQAVFDATTEVAIVATRVDGLITVFNRGAEKLLGYDAADMVGRERVLALYDAHELAQRGTELSVQLGRPVEGFDVLVAVAANSGYEVRDWTYLRRNGARVSVSVAITAVRNGGPAPAGYLLVATDQTERHRAAGLELARQVAEAASQNKSEFLARVSHDLRTPLNAMLGFAQLLALDAKQPLTQVQRDRVALIETAGWHLVRMIDDLLDLSRIDSGHLRVSMEAVDLCAAIDDAVRMVAGQAATQRIRIDWTAPATAGGEPLLAWADRTRLIQVLVNLLTNAVKYNVEGGRVELRIDAGADDALQVDIVDTGRGMNEDQLQRLFEPFDRLGMESSDIEGTGIGLVIVKRLLALMDGSIEVQSRVGTGTRARVNVQRAERPSPLPSSPTTEAAPVPDSQGIVDVVCVEDNPVNSALIEQIMALRPSCRLHLVNSKEKGLALIRSLRPALVLLDLHLPDGSGLHIVDQLRVDPELAATPVIVISADGTRHSARAARLAGVKAFLGKPIKIGQVLDAIDQVLAERLASTLPDRA